ncbi:cytochrome-c oxidase, cbb3-type subunit III [Coralloluteibacterium stylophorae]|uniref:Cbb3-type cytochrome c oxidase subunit n=1 Tax=Coralloluteibacterium stylophorae TaxID=1776034 RepID=A0A8J7VUY4_9GAMM|nr:cytochrome-c oxidase, cbb3-type subunit III [Coralloluteibacterium stylophorae]MBS7457427.1 cytochrome-c oxidase, cbb3-type subunit III [Coralloluteibacterium stylophorae]
MSAGWSWYVIALIVLNVGGCVWLLWWTGRQRPGDPKPTDTSHVWDGDITEYNKPLPRWWINLFYLTIVFAIGYLAWFPGFGDFDGFGDWSSAREHDVDAAARDAQLAEAFAPYGAMPVGRIARNPTALALGRSIFSSTCAGCHGSSAQGAIGYPNLTDDIWHWGGSPERVLETVLDGREGVMPAWGTALTNMGGEHAVTSVIAHLRVLGGKLPASDYFASRGKPLYDGICAGCHGIDGTGNVAMGAPDLTDDYWLYGGDTESLRTSIAEGRHGSMPPHRGLLGETRAKLVAAYVWSLSNPAPADAADTRAGAP